MLTLTNENSTTGGKLLTVLLGPVTGLAYIIALPFMAIATVAGILGGKAVSSVAGVVAGIVSFGWRPAESYLSGKDKKKKNNRTK